MALVADRHDGLAAAEGGHVAARTPRLGVEHHIAHRQVGAGADHRTGQLGSDFVVDRDHVHVNHRGEVRLVALNLARHARHRLDGLHGIVAHGRLVAQHHGIDPFVDGARHVAHLGPRRAGVLHHRVEHLRGDNHRTLGGDALLDDAALRIGNRLGRQLDTQVAAGHHDAVRRLDNLVDVVQTLLVLDFRDNLNRAPVRVENLLHGGHVAGAAHERVGDEVNVVAHGPLDEAAVLLRNRRKVNRDARHVDALARAHAATHRKFAAELIVALLQDANLHLAVCDEHARPDGDVADDGRDVHVDHLARSEVVAHRAADAHDVAHLEVDAVAVLLGDGRHPNLGALGIYHNRNGGVDAVHRLHDARGALLAHVGRVDAHDIHTCIVELLDKLFGATEIRHRRNHLGSFLSVHVLSR